jgi:UDP-N-acetyl-D-mannosaminuronate dehydrogenase
VKDKKPMQTAISTPSLSGTTLKEEAITKLQSRTARRDRALLIHLSSNGAGPSTTVAEMTKLLENVYRCVNMRSSTN